MKLKPNSLFLISGLLTTFSISNYAEAAYTKYAKIGSENAENYSFKAASTGEVKAYFVGSAAGYINDISMSVNGVDTGKHGLVNNNFGALKKATYGQSFSFGNVNKGDKLVFRLNVNLDKPAVNRVYFSDKTMNIDGMNHIYSSVFTTDGIIPNGAYVAFEDLSSNKNYNVSRYVCDFNYSDENFVFTNVGVETVGNCPTLSALSATVPSYAVSNDSSQVRICHNDTSKKTNPFILSMVSFSALNAHLNNHGDYFTMSGICPTDSEPCPSLPSVCPAPLVFNADKTACMSQAIPVKPTVTPVVTTDNQTAKPVGGAVGTSTALTIEIKDSNGESKTSGAATLSGTAPNQTWTYLPPVLPANGNANAIYQVTATGDSAHGSLTDTNTDELIVTPATTHIPTVNAILSDNSFDIVASRGTISSAGTQAIEDTTPTIQGTVGAEVLGSDTFTVTLTKEGSTISTGATPTYNGTIWLLVVQTPLAAGVYEVNAVRTAGGTATSDATHNELVIGVLYCNGGVSGYILRSDFEGLRDAATYYLGACGSAVMKAIPNPYPDDLQPQKSGGAGVFCTDAEGEGDRNTLSISIATIKRATIINATTLGGTMTKNLGDTVINYGEKSGGTMDISNAFITNGVATNVTLTDATINNLYLDMAGSFDVATGTFSPGDTYISVNDGSTGTTQPSGDGVTIPKSQIIDGVITSGIAADMPIRGRILAGFYNVNTSPTTMTLTKGRRTTGTLTGATITGATTTTASVNSAIKTIVSGGTITNGSFAVTSTFGTVINAKIENATITNVNSCFTSGTVGSRGQMNWKEVIQE